MPAEDDENEHDLAQVRRQIRNAVQRLVPLRFAFLEGNHRVELAIRKLYGVPLNVTMEVGQVEPVFESSLEPTCALFQPLPVRLLQYPSKHVLLSNGMLQDLIAMSKQIMVEKQTSIDTSWRQCMNHAYDYLDGADFFCNNMPQFTKFYSYARPETVKGDKCDGHPLMKRSKDSVKALYEFMKSHDTSKSIIADAAKKGEAIEDGIKKCIKQYLCPPGVVTLKKIPDTKKILRGSGVAKLGYSINGMLWLFSVLSAHQDSWDFLKTYLSSTRENIHDPDFILAYVMGPVNYIANFLSTKMIQMILSEKEVFPKKVNKKDRNWTNVLTYKLRHWIRVSYTQQFLTILMEFGVNPEYNAEKNMKQISEWFQNNSYGNEGKKIENTVETMSYRGMIQALFLCWPEFVEKNAGESIQTILDTSHEANKLGVDKVTSTHRWVSNVYHVMNDLKTHEYKVTIDNSMIGYNRFLGLLPNRLRLSKKKVMLMLKGEFEMDTWITKATFIEEEAEVDKEKKKIQPAVEQEGQAKETMESSEEADSRKPAAKSGTPTRRSPRKRKRSSPENKKSVVEDVEEAQMTSNEDEEEVPPSDDPSYRDSDNEGGEPHAKKRRVEGENSDEEQEYDESFAELLAKDYVNKMQSYARLRGISNEAHVAHLTMAQRALQDKMFELQNIDPEGSVCNNRTLRTFAQLGHTILVNHAHVTPEDSVTRQKIQDVLVCSYIHFAEALLYKHVPSYECTAVNSTEPQSLRKWQEFTEEIFSENTESITDLIQQYTIGDDAPTNAVSLMYETMENLRNVMNQVQTNENVQAASLEQSNGNDDEIDPTTGLTKNFEQGPHLRVYEDEDEDDDEDDEDDDASDDASNDSVKKETASDEDDDASNHNAKNHTVSDENDDVSDQDDDASDDASNHNTKADKASDEDYEEEKDESEDDSEDEDDN